jgi:sugar transferase (PEP-CTERM/EpsH1 system associated)
LSRVRVVHVPWSFGPGGMERGILRCIQRASPDIEHVIVCITIAGRLRSELPDGVQVFDIDQRPGERFGHLRRMRSTLRGLRPCVVHTRNWSGMDGIIAARTAGIRSIVHGEHGWAIEDPDGTNRKRIVIRRFLSRFVRRFTCVSRDIEEYLERTGVKCPVTQIYNGVDTDEFRPDAAERADVRRELGIAADAPVIGMVARMDPIKDHATLLSAFERVRAQRPDAQLVLAGKGPDEEKIAAAAGAGVHVLGDRSDVPRLLRGMDLFALTSLNEGISNTILEAMASGMPVVATRVGGNPELVVDGQTGALFPVGDDEELARVLLGYIEDDARRRAHSEAAREHIIATFSLDSMVANYEKVWRETAAGIRASH